MARAKSLGICRKCGKEYLKPMTEPMNWDSGICMECNLERQQKEEEAAGLTAEVQLDYAAAEKGMAEAVIVVTGCGYLYREQLKSIGYQFTRNIPSQMWREEAPESWYARTQKKYLVKRITLNDINAAIAEIVALGGKCAAPTAPEVEELREYTRFVAEGAQQAATEAETNA